MGGVAQGFNMEFDDAILNLDGAIKVLELRIERLKSKAESVDPTKVGDAFSTREKEIKEIESLIPEIREKIADTKDMKTETHKRLREKRVMELFLNQETVDHSMATVYQRQHLPSHPILLE